MNRFSAEVEPAMEMSQEHKDALKQGRQEARAMKAYLEALQRRGPGRPVTSDSLRAQVERVNAKITENDDPLRTVELVQRRLDLESAIADLDAARDFDELEAGFTRHVRSYSERKGITYSAWREVGVPARTLKSGGVPETRRR